MSPKTGEAWIAILGGVSVRIGDTPTSIGGPTPQRLLALLVNEHGQTVSISRLVETLWFEQPPRTAHRSVQTLVSRLRQTLGASFIERVGAGYRLRADAGLRIDSHEFADLVKNAQRTPSTSSALDQLDRALELWHGQPFGDIGDEPAFVTEARRLAELRVVAIETRATLLLGQGEESAPIADLEALVASNPLRGRPHGLLMQALWQSHRSVDAVRVYQRYRERLRDETGLEPAQELRDLEARIIREASAPRPGQSSTPFSLRGLVVESRLASTDTGDRYVATQVETGRSVVIETVRTGPDLNPTDLRTVAERCRRWAQVIDAHVVVLLDVWRDKDGLHIVTPHATSTLADRIAKGDLDRNEALRIAGEAARGLAALRRAGVRPVSLRPEHIILDGDSGSRLSAVHLLDPERTAVEPDDANETDVIIELLATMQRGLADTTARASDNPKSEAVLLVDGADASSDLEALGAHLSSLGSAADGPRAGRRNPYKGLRSFHEGDQRDFFGRDELIARTVQSVQTEPVTTLVGPSGCGKTSVLRAGVLPRITQAGHSYWPVVLSPGSHPWAELEAELLRVSINPPPSLLSQMRDGPDGLLRAVLRTVPDRESSTVLVVIDQFEELWTHLDDSSERNAFIDALVTAAMAERSPLRLVTAIRADYLGHALDSPTFAPTLQGGAVLVPPLTVEGMERAIRLPLEGQGIGIETQLIAQIAQDAAGATGNLPFLQFALRELFDRESTMLTLRQYQELGGLGGSMSRHAEELFASLRGDERDHVRRMFRRLVTTNPETRDTRRRVPRPELDSVSPEALAKLVTGRLLTTGRSTTGESYVEVAHEALIDGWPRLRQWIDEDRGSIDLIRRIGAATALWRDGGFDDEDLLRGRRLQEAHLLLEDRPDDFTHEEADFLNESKHRLKTSELEQQQHQLKELLLAAREISGSSPREALRLAREAVDLDSASAQSLGAVQAALVACDNWLGRLGSGPWTDAHWIDERTAVLRDAKGVAWWDTDSLIEVRRVDGFGAGPISSDGDVVVIGCADGRVQWLDAADGHLLGMARLPSPAAALACLSGMTAVAGSRDGAIGLVHPDQPPDWLGSANFCPTGIAVSPDESMLAVVGGLGHPLVEWDLTNRTCQTIMTSSLAFRAPAAFSCSYLSDGSLAVATEGIQIFGPSRELAYEAPTGNMVISARIETIGELLWVSTAEARLEAFDHSGQLVSTAPAQGRLTASSVAPDGTRALTLQAGGRVDIRSLDGRTVLGPAWNRAGAQMVRLDRTGRFLALSMCDGVSAASQLIDTVDPTAPVHRDEEWCYLVFRNQQTEPVYWNAASRLSETFQDRPNHRLPLPFSNIHFGDVELTSDGRYAIQACITGVVQVFDRTTGELVTELHDFREGTATTSPGPENVVTDVEISPDGLHMAGTAYPGVCIVWEIGTWRPISRSDDGPIQLAYADASTIVTISGEGVLAERGALDLSAVTRAVTLPSSPKRSGSGDGLDITADGRWIVASLESGVQLIDAQSFEPVGVPFPDIADPRPPGIAREALIATSSSEDRVHLWDLNPDRWIEIADRLLYASAESDTTS